MIRIASAAASVVVLLSSGVLGAKGQEMKVVDAVHRLMYALYMPIASGMEQDRIGLMVAKSADGMLHVTALENRRLVLAAQTLLVVTIELDGFLRVKGLEARGRLVDQGPNAWTGGHGHDNEMHRWLVSEGGLSSAAIVRKLESESPRWLDLLGGDIAIDYSSLRLVERQHSQGYRLAWELSASRAGVGNAYQIDVDAFSGMVVMIRRRTAGSVRD